MQKRLLWALLVSWPAGAGADVILLQNGNEIQGEIIEETPHRLTVRFLGGTLTIHPRDVAGVRRESRLEYLLEQGDGALRREDAEGAISIFEKARREDASSPRALEGLLAARERSAEGLAAAGRFEEAMETLSALLRDAPERAGARAALHRIAAALRAAEAEEAAGRDALHRGAIEEALTRLRDVHDRFPGRRARVAPHLAQALIRSADRLLESGRFEEAEGRYLEAVSIEPDLVPAMASPFAYARARRLAPLAERGELKKVLEEAEEGLRVSPQSDLLAYLKGVSLEGLGKRSEAAQVYRKIAGDGGGPGGGPARKSLETLRALAEARITASSGPKPAADPRRDEVLPGSFREMETEHFLVRHHNEVIAREVARAAEEAYDRLFQELAVKSHWVKRCAIVLYPTKEEFQTATGFHLWTGGAHRIRRRLGVLADHQIFSYQSQPRLAGAVIPHEVAHAMLAHRLGYRHQVPLWLNEGFAIYWEPPYVHRHHQRIAAQAARARTLIPLARLLSMETYPADDEEVKLFYAESHSLVDLLLDEKEIPELIEFAGDLASKADSLDALLDRRYRIRGVKALENRWLARLTN